MHRYGNHLRIEHHLLFHVYFSVQACVVFLESRAGRNRGKMSQFNHHQGGNIHLFDCLCYRRLLIGIRALDLGAQNTDGIGDETLSSHYPWAGINVGDSQEPCVIELTNIYSASVAAIGRLANVQKLGDGTDILFERADIAIWSACETGLGLSASCAATLKPLFRTFSKNHSEETHPMPDINRVAAPRKKHSMQPLSTSHVSETAVESQVHSRRNSIQTDVERGLSHDHTSLELTRYDRI